MTDTNPVPQTPHEEPSPAESIRRVTAKDRKPRLPSAGGLFPPETQPDSAPSHRKPENEADRFPPVAPQLTDDPTPKNLRPRQPQPMAAKRNRRRSRRQNTIALLFFLATVGVLAYFVYLWQNPYSLLNPFAPQLLVTVVTATPEGFVSTPMPTTMRLQLEGVTYATNSSNCEVFVISGSLITNTRYAVRLTGGGRDDGVLTGNVPGIGDNGFWFEIAYADLTTSVLMLEFFDTGGNAMADPVSVTVRSGCDENLAIVRLRASANP